MRLRAFTLIYCFSFVSILAHSFPCSASESEEKAPFSVELYPKNFAGCEDFEKEAAGDCFQCISNPEVFWANPEK